MVRWRGGAEGAKARAPRRSNSLEMVKRKARLRGQRGMNVQTETWKAEGRGYQGWDDKGE